MLEEPLRVLVFFKFPSSLIGFCRFLAADAGGKNLIPGVPMMASNLGQGCANIARNAGLYAGHMTCFRREAGNLFGILLGKEMGALLLGHAQEHAVYDTHYSRNVANLPVVPLVLGEIRDVNDTQRAMLTQHSRNSSAVTCLLNRMDMSSQQGGPVKSSYTDTKRNTRSSGVTLSKEQLEAIENTPDMLEFSRAVNEKWISMMDFLRPAEGITPAIFEKELAQWTLEKHRSRGNIERIAKNSKFDSTDPDAYCNCRTELDRTFQSMINLRQRLRKSARAALKKAANEDLAGGVPKVMRTANERNEALERVRDDPSVIFGLAASAAEDAANRKGKGKQAVRTPVLEVAQDSVEIHTSPASANILDTTTRATAAPATDIADTPPRLLPPRALGEILPMPQSVSPDDLTEWMANMDYSMPLEAVEESPDDSEITEHIKYCIKKYPVKILPQAFELRRQGLDLGMTAAMLDRDTTPELSREETENFWTEAPKEDAPPTVDDDLEETEVLNLPLDTLRAYILEFAVQPIVEEREREARKGKDGLWHCTDQTETGEPCDFSANKWRPFDRHTRITHARWRSLIDESKIPSSSRKKVRWLCPSGDNFMSKTQQELEEHCLSSACLRHLDNIAMRHEYQVACDTYSKDARYLRKKGKVAAKAQSVPSTSRAEDGDHAKQDPPRHQTKVEGVDGDASTDVVECDEDDPVLLNLLQLNVEDIIEMAQQLGVPLPPGGSDAIAAYLSASQESTTA